MIRNTNQRLATYGTLSPGKPNEHVLAELEGKWSAGHVRGNFVDTGWAANLGFPALELDPNGEKIAVDIFESSALPTLWPQLDDFEGADYQRVATRVETSSGHVEAWIYVTRR